MKEAKTVDKRSKHQNEKFIKKEKTNEIKTVIKEARIKNKNASKNR
jgi:hypothetical protein